MVDLDSFGWALATKLDKTDIHPRRIRLVAYGARLESVLGASPRGFESPILRQKTGLTVGFLSPKYGYVWLLENEPSG